MSPIWNNRLTVARMPGGVPPTAVLLVAVLALAGCASGPRDADTAGAEGSEVVAALTPELETGYASALEFLAAADPASALPLLVEVVAARPDLAGPLVNLGIAQAATGDLEAARATLEKATALRPGAAEPWNELGLVNRRLGDFEGARNAYETALRCDPAYAKAHFNLAVLLDLYLQESAPALAHYEQYRELADPPDENVDVYIADLARRVENDLRTAGVVDENL
jgi:tetratricopeptide (TPR) repeat protein